MLAEVFVGAGLLLLGGLLGLVTGVSLARLGRRGESLPQPLVLRPLLLALAGASVFMLRALLDWLLPGLADGSLLQQMWLSAGTLAGTVFFLRVFSQAPAWFCAGQVRRRWGWALRVWIMGMPGFLAVVLWNNFMFKHWIPGGHSADPLANLSSVSAAQVGWLALGSCLVLPMLEEMLFRGYLFRGLAGAGMRLSAVRALAISSTLFALSHRPDMWLPALYLGCLLGWMDWRGADLRLCILAHVAHNSFFFALALF